MSNRLDRRGFTLIELLVVIAIISILAAILFPVFATAREKARQASCASNLKQMGLATMQYTQDFDETYPTGYWNSGSKYVYWYNIIMPYVAGASSNTALINFCPSSPYPTNLGYSVNPRVVGSSSPEVATGFFSYTTTATLPMLTHPSDTILYGDADQIPSYGNTPNCLYRLNPGSVNGGAWNAFAAPNNNTNWATIDNDNNIQATSPGQVRYRHTGFANFAFCDGHVKAMARNTVTVWNWQIGGDTPDVLSGSPTQYRLIR